MNKVIATPEKRPKLSIVIPAYKEERRLGETLDLLAKFLRNNQFWASKTVEVIIVAVDGPDKTSEIVSSKVPLFRQLTLLRPSNKVGKGRDVQQGMLYARGDAVIYMDADLATPLHHMEAFYKYYQAGSDIIIGTRDLLRHHKSIPRRMTSVAGNVLFRFVSGVWIEDSQCGFKMFSRKASQRCFSKMTLLGWSFDMEILAIAKANHLKMMTVRLEDWEDKPHSTFTDGIGKIMLWSLKDLCHIAIHRARRLYSN